MTMINNYVCVILSMFLILMEVLVYYIKPDFSYAINDEHNYVVSYQRWIRVVLFSFSIGIAVLVIYFAVNQMVNIAYAFLGLQAIIDYCYILTRYKKVVVTDENIYVYRFMRYYIECKFNDISKVNYIPNSRIQILLNNKLKFDVSFNSNNFNTLYMDLINHNVKFKTGNIPGDQTYVYIEKFDITIDFPKSMFREYYQSKTYFRNSHYIFSARSLENHEYIEGYYKDTDRELNEFIEYVKNDLSVNGYKCKKEIQEVINELNFTIIKSVNNDNPEEGRYAYIYHGYDSYFVIYATYLMGDEVFLANKLKKAIRKSIYEDTRDAISKA